ncbi:neuron navigator 3-like isoform X2 [Liolophura sinensis]|uniref:neuron navigator 3-like isoform X2 n=1 Tax=Liolophura sinensis TaxID=3198878 RepID=UPI00315938D2
MGLLPVMGARNKIYTDWANHYLEKARNKRFISDLQEDITDGVLLADVIEAVTNEKVKDIKMKPKNSAQMVENINNCLTFLGNLGVNVEGLSAKDIKDGNLKAILGLFFSLSRFKQQQKSQQQSHKGKDKDKDSDKEKTVQINTDPPPSGENKGQGGGCNSSASCGGSTPTQPNQLNGGEMISRLPSPFSKSNKSSLSSASVNKVESSNANANSRLKSSNSERLKAQLNQQNNNIQPQNSGTSQLNSKNLNNNCSKETPSGIPTRATSPGGQHSGIPTPGGRLLGSVRGQSFSDKHASKLSTSTSSTSSTGSGTGSSGTSCKGLQKGGAANKNSMLDKFKFFNSKEKEKSKSGVAKSASKSSTAASATSSSSKSESDSRSGLNLRGTNATDGATSGSSSPKTGIRGLKKGWGRSSSKRDAASHKKASEDNASKRSTPSPSPSPQGQPPLPGSGLASGHRNSPTPSRKAASAKSSDKNDKHASQHSPPSSKKGSKVSSLIPKSASGCKPKTSTSSNSLSSAAGIQPASHIPGYASTGIPKPGGKTGKSSSEKGDKSKSGSSKESKSNGNGSISQKSSSVGSKSSQAQQLPQQLAQHPGMSYAENGSYGKAKSTDVRLESRVDRMHNAISNNSSANTQYSKNSMSSSPAPSSAPPLPPRNPNMSGRPITPQNVPKMDQSTQYTTNSRPLPNSGSLAKNLNNQSSASKSDGNTQTSLSALQRVVSPGKSPPMKDVSNASISSNDSMSTGATSQSDSTPSSNSGGNKSGSSNESVIFRPSSCDELSGSEKSVSNSPKLGVKSLLSQSPSAKIHVPHVSHVSHPQPSTVTQPTHPRPTEKMETTFDTEVRTETISNVPKETTFSDKQETTFTDDSGETLDIKPMQPIMRALPYGYFRGLTSAAGANKNFHIPGISVPTSMYGSISSRLAINRSLADPSRMYPHPVKKAGSHVLEPDYGSDLDTYDYVSGYMSDGDILKSNRLDDSCSGYMSEGGASLYARRLQQRFREGMQAVKECMQKSSGLIDDDSFDDSSSISSGEISDTIAEISTDENLTGSSQSACSDHTNPFSSLKRVPKDILRVTPNGSVPINGKRNLLIASNGREYYAPEYNGAPSWRKFSMPSTGKYFSDQEDYGNPYNGYDQWHRSDPNGIIPPGRKLSITSQPELGSAYYRPDSGSYSESDRSSYMSTCSNKRECETNTDQSFLQDNMRKMQARSSNSLGTAYGYRRPLSNTSTCSVGSNKSTGSKGSVSGRLVKNGTPTDRFSDTASVKSNPERLSSYDNVPTCIPRPASATPRTMTESGSNGFHRDPRTDMGPEAYNSSTLERRKRGNFASSRSLSSGSAQTDTELYKSNTLGRRRLFGSKNSLSKGTSAGEHMCASTIISNPHATYSKEGGNRQNGNSFLSPDYSSPRNSAMTNGANGNSWLKSSSGNLSSSTPMSETESMESLSSAASSIQAQIQQARALSGASARILAHQRAELMGQGDLQRSNSIRSTQSERIYSSHHGALPEDLPPTTAYAQVEDSPPNQPSSPTPSNSSQSSSRFTYPMTAYAGMLSSGGGLTQSMVRSNTQSSLPYSSLALSKMNSKDEEGSLHGSNLSLVSNSSSVYSSAEEKQAHEIRKLRRELEHAQEKVITLTTQLSANRIGGYGNNPQFLAASSQQAHVVAAFEQSLSNMTARLQHLTTTAEHKDSELNELRATIEALKRQSSLNIPEILISPNAPQKHSTPVIHSAKDQHLHVNGTDGRSISRQMSSDSMSSINSLSSACSVTSQQSAATDGDCKSKKKKKGWLRSSFSKAFSRKKSKHGSMSDCEPDTASLHSDMSAPNSPLLQNHMVGGSPLKGSQSMVEEGTSSVTDLKKQLREKDMKLTDIRLEALTSAHQLEQLKETMSKMKNEMSALKADNDRLHKMMSSRSLNTSQSSLQQRSSSDSLERALSMGEQSSLDILTLQENIDREGKRVTITVILGSNPDPLKRVEKLFETLIGSLSVSGKTKWDILDSIVRKIFKEYVLRVDPVTNLGLNAESVYSYHVGEITRTKDAETPELLPVGYLVGDTMQIGICLKGTHQNSVDSLAFETLIPKSIVQRYVSLLLEHRRIILCGPSGTGKTYLAQKLSEHLVLRSGKKLTAGSIATFNVDHKSAKELRQYLSNIAEQCESTSVGELPSVIILDNLHHVGSLGEVFNGFLSVKYQKCPYIIGTMNQATCSTTNLQLHHNFRWVLCANHMEPVKGFLGRFLRRKLVEAEVRMGTRNNDLNKIIDWIPKVWQHLNKFLETHSSSDVTIGPRLFLSCPMDIAGSQVWFTDLWNYSIIPYLLEAVREGLQMYGKRAPWEDPADWVIETYPWSNNSNQDWPSLLRLRPEDVGFDTQGVAPPQIKNNPTIKETTSEGEGDPLMSMLMRLQEAASYSSPQSNDSDSTSLDSHSSIIQEVSTSSAEST